MRDSREFGLTKKYKETEVDRQEIEIDRWGLGWYKVNGVERDRHQSGLIKRYEEIKVDSQKIETNICRWIYVK